jgi:HPt (histidine-containing phosphotransfer) domain-containing protein
MEAPNFDYINELGAGDKVFINKLIAVIKEELPQEIELYNKNFNSSAFIKAAESVHKLKHKLGIMGMVDGYNTAIAYEEELKMGGSSLKSEFDILLEACNRFINEL